MGRIAYVCRTSRGKFPMKIQIPNENCGNPIDATHLPPFSLHLHPSSPHSLPSSPHPFPSFPPVAPHQPASPKCKAQTQTLAQTHRGALAQGGGPPPAPHSPLPPDPTPHVAPGLHHPHFTSHLHRAPHPHLAPHPHPTSRRHLTNHHPLSLQQHLQPHHRQPLHPLSFSSMQTASCLDTRNSPLSYPTGA